jgi:hypothetical protein
VKAMLKGQRFKDPNELFTAMSAAWDSIDMPWVNVLTRTFRARCRVSVDVGGSCLNRHWGRVKAAGRELAGMPAL